MLANYISQHRSINDVRKETNCFKTLFGNCVTSLVLLLPDCYSSLWDFPAM